MAKREIYKIEEYLRQTLPNNPRNVYIELLIRWKISRMHIVGRTSPPP
jgi:hypothetical protein